MLRRGRVGEGQQFERGLEVLDVGRQVLEVCVQVRRRRQIEVAHHFHYIRIL